MWPFNRLSLFWKIFLWFWLAMLLMVSVTVITWLLYRDSINFHPADKNMKAVMSKLAYVLESDMSEHRKERTVKKLLRSFAPPIFKHDHDKHPKMPFYFLLDEQGKDKQGYRIPEAAIALWKQQGDRIQVAAHKDFVYLGPHPLNVDGKSYQLIVPQYIGRFKARMVLHVMHSISPWQIISYLFVSAALCLALAWSLTRPIKSLQMASRRIASGESVSAKELLGSRRDEFYSLASDFDLMAGKILETVNTQKQLLSDVSHELRSPLTRMQIAIGLLDKDLGNGHLKTLQRLEHECARMDEMIGQLLSIAALERGQIYEQEQNIDLVAMLNELIRDADFEAAQKRIRLLSDFSSEVELTGYYALLRSSLENILRNAIRYAPEDSVVEVNLILHAKEVHVEISDQGPGVSDENLDKIFQPFFRTDEARSREQGGAGLGLAIAARAVAVHKGKIVAKPNQPKGLKVIISLPLD